MVYNRRSNVLEPTLQKLCLCPHTDRLRCVLSGSIIMDKKMTTFPSHLSTMSSHTLHSRSLHLTCSIFSSLHLVTCQPVLKVSFVSPSLLLSLSLALLWKIYLWTEKKQILDFWFKQSRICWFWMVSNFACAVSAAVHLFINVWFLKCMEWFVWFPKRFSMEHDASEKLQCRFCPLLGNLNTQCLLTMKCNAQTWAEKQNPTEKKKSHFCILAFLAVMLSAWSETRKLMLVCSFFSLCMKFSSL